MRKFVEPCSCLFVTVCSTYHWPVLSYGFRSWPEIKTKVKMTKQQSFLVNCARVSSKHLKLEGNPSELFDRLIVDY